MTDRSDEWMTLAASRPSHSPIHASDDGHSDGVGHGQQTDATATATPLASTSTIAASTSTIAPTAHTMHTHADHNAHTLATDASAPVQMDTTAGTSAPNNSSGSGVTSLDAPSAPVAAAAAAPASTGPLALAVVPLTLVERRAAMAARVALAFQQAAELAAQLAAIDAEVARASSVDAQDAAHRATAAAATATTAAAHAAAERPSVPAMTVVSGNKPVKLELQPNGPVAAAQAVMHPAATANALTSPESAAPAPVVLNGLHTSAAADSAVVAESSPPEPSAATAALKKRGRDGVTCSHCSSGATRNACRCAAGKAERLARRTALRQQRQKEAQAASLAVAGAAATAAASSSAVQSVPSVTTTRPRRASALNTPIRDWCSDDEEMFNSSDVEASADHEPLSKKARVEQQQPEQQQQQQLGHGMPLSAQFGSPVDGGNGSQLLLPASSASAEAESSAAASADTAAAAADTELLTSQTDNQMQDVALDHSAAIKHESPQSISTHTPLVQVVKPVPLTPPRTPTRRLDAADASKDVATSLALPSAALAQSQLSTLDPSSSMDDVDAAVVPSAASVVTPTPSSSTAAHSPPQVQVTEPEVQDYSVMLLSTLFSGVPHATNHRISGCIGEMLGSPLSRNQPRLSNVGAASAAGASPSSASAAASLLQIEPPSRTGTDTTASFEILSPLSLPPLRIDSLLAAASSQATPRAALGPTGAIALKPPPVARARSKPRQKDGSSSGAQIQAQTQTQMEASPVKISSRGRPIKPAAILDEGHIVAKLPSQVKAIAATVVATATPIAAHPIAVGAVATAGAPHSKPPSHPKATATPTKTPSKLAINRSSASSSASPKAKNEQKKEEGRKPGRPSLAATPAPASAPASASVRGVSRTRESLAAAQDAHAPPAAAASKRSSLSGGGKWGQIEAPDGSMFTLSAIQAQEWTSKRYEPLEIIDKRRLFGYNEWLVRWAHWPPMFDRWEDASHLALYTTRKPQQMLAEYRLRQTNEKKEEEKEAAATAPTAAPSKAALAPPAATAVTAATTAAASEETKQQA